MTDAFTQEKNDWHTGKCYFCLEVLHINCYKYTAKERHLVTERKYNASCVALKIPTNLFLQPIVLGY